MFKSNVPLISNIGNHLVGSGGKRLRPLFHILSAGLAGYKGDKHIPLASIIESVHTASLLHDDVVDGADFRRGSPSANSLWSNQVVILVGDFLYSNALRLTVTFKDQKILEVLASSANSMTLGELTQLHRSHDISITEEEYFEIISAKTGSLISVATRIGGILAQVSDRKVEALADFGLQVGNAFQVVDDILDYKADEDELGKTLGKDLHEGKVTLPMIYLLRHVNDTERSDIKIILDSDEITDNSLNRILELFKKYDALREAEQKARSIVDDARADLDVFADCREKTLLLDIAEYSLQREK
ncbi:polyprenyl synthetase family protein [Nitrospirota bacterium]